METPKFIFITRLACDFGQFRGHHRRPIAKIASLVDCWHRFGSKFYEAQTVQAPFEVRLIYSPPYRALVHRREYPDWATLHLLAGHPAYDLSGEEHRPLVVSRIDVDDQYSIHFFEVMTEIAGRILRARAAGKPTPNLVLHQLSVQYHRKWKTTRGPTRDRRPHFTSLVFGPGDGPINYAELRKGVCDGHGTAGKRPHVKSDPHVLALEGIGGNVANRWKGGKGSIAADPRFIYHGADARAGRLPDA